MWPFSKRRTTEDVKRAMQEREASEKRLVDAQHNVIGPLMQLRRDLAEKNHIAERFTILIQGHDQERHDQ